MKASRTRIANAKAKAAKIKAGPPKVSKYAAKIRAGYEPKSAYAPGYANKGQGQ